MISCLVVFLSAASSIASARKVSQVNVQGKPPTVMFKMFGTQQPAGEAS
jgi:hypothetical protein